VGEDLGFGGEVAGFYHQYRRGYPQAVIDALMSAFALTSDDVVIDLGCGTGQLTLPIASRVRAVAGVDPEPDMLARARRAAADQGSGTRAGCSAPTPLSPRWQRCSAAAAPGR
jgi:ubiquinone/menaquinone biosynthesis C-methylase UbiE